MTQAFLDSLKKTANVATTENGAIVRNTTNSALLDFFSLGGAIRTRTANDQVSMFARAWNENPELALKMLFYFRDARGGQGQRGAFRNQIKFLAEIDPAVLRKNLENVPFYGRWDDLYTLVDTDVSDDVFNLIRLQLESDLENMKNGESVSLLAKWLKSENASSKETRHLAHMTRRALDMSPKQYRKTLSSLRKYIDVVERKMSAKDWNSINYSAVPSNAMLKYGKAFGRNDGERFREYLSAVNSGGEKINASVLYPHEIVAKTGAIDLNWYRGNNDQQISNEQAQAMWDALPNYIGEEENSIAVVDTSDSMKPNAIMVSVSLGMYLAERAKGPYKDHFITFSAKPTLQKVKGTSLVSKIKGVSKAHWEMNTNIEAVFDLILNTAVKHKLSQEDMIDKLYIISDMQFDSATRGHRADATLFETMRDRFEAAGYDMPKLVFWNVDARHDQVPMSMDERGFQNVSGFSPSIFKNLMGGKFYGAYELMLDVITDERYERIAL